MTALEQARRTACRRRISSRRWRRGRAWATTDTREQERQAQMELVERLHNERVSQRGIARISGVSRPTIIAWLRKKVFRPIGKTLTPMMGRPEIEIDEQWSYVGSRQQEVQSLPADDRKRGVFYTDE